MRSHVSLQMRTFKVRLSTSWVATDVTSYPRWVNLRSDFCCRRGKPWSRGNGRESGAIWAHHWRLWALDNGLGYDKHDGTFGYLSAHEYNRGADWWLTGWSAGNNCCHNRVVCREGNHLTDDRHGWHCPCWHCRWRDQHRLLLWGHGGWLRSTDDCLWGRHTKVIKCSTCFLVNVCHRVSLTFGSVWWHSCTRYVFSNSLNI